MWRNILVYFGTVGIVVGGALWYLNRDVCEECEAQRRAEKEAFCKQELARYQVDEQGDYIIGYKDRLVLAAKGCL
ncbi:MAG: hypothetical protein KatS3mg099_156 [Candidatus Parcubacteria bacterium]|nr:MAG: hypothetical protein KatS3mg099_156 [Candidatus Parcubacteria bacterium]